MPLTSPSHMPVSCPVERFFSRFVTDKLRTILGSTSDLYHPYQDRRPRPRFNLRPNGVAFLGVDEGKMRLHCEEPTTTKTMPSRRNPPADGGCGRYLCCEPQVDAKISTSVSRLDLAGKTHRRGSRCGWYRSQVRIFLSILENPREFFLAWSKFVARTPKPYG